MDELSLLDATAQADLVRTGTVTALELVDAAITRIQHLDRDLNAVIWPSFEQARDAATSADLPPGPFRGVPFLIKDLLCTEAGRPYAMGNRALKNAAYRAPRDTALARRFRAAGLVTVGRTNTPEFGIQSTTQPAAFGATRNPWDHDRSVSGSSGGSAAAVSAGLVPIAHATDGGGSIRLPAAWCGLVGLKPSWGRTPSAPRLTNTIVEHVVTRSVRDAAAALDVVHSATPAHRRVASPRLQDEPAVDPGQLCIGIVTSAPGINLHRACLAATEDTGLLLESLGHIVRPESPTGLFEPVVDGRDLKAATAAELCRTLGEVASMLGRPVQEEDVEPFTWALAHATEPAPAAAYLRLQRARQEWAAQIEQWWKNGFDLLLTPTVYEPAVLIDELTPPADNPAQLARRVVAHCRFTQPFNVTGQPAISLPLHETEDGLPIGVQLIADYARDDLLLHVARQLETARPWADRYATLPD